MPNDTRPSDKFIDFADDGKLFPTAISSDFGAFVRECVDFYHLHPQVGLMIEQDQRRDALAAKHERARAAYDEFVRTMPLEGFAASDLAACSLELGKGRPRIHPLAVFIFLLLRGRGGGPCRREVRELMLESRSLEAALAPYLESLPGATTILENINVVSNDTVEAIKQMQLAQVQAEGLDDFTRIAVDSTAVEASSAWPTDSKTIRDLCGRFLRVEQQLKSFGFTVGGCACGERWLEQLTTLHQRISMVGSGQGSPSRRRKLYQEFYLVAVKLLEKLYHRQKRILHWLGQARLSAWRRELAEELAVALRTDVSDACLALTHSIDRLEGMRLPKARERILGLADRNAAIIVKGGREPVMGYKPQLARSGEGFITAILVEQGNGADSVNLLPLVQTTIAYTGVIPEQVSGDDGYASAGGLDAVRALGVKEVSISGSKGKRLLAEEWDLPSLRQLRAWRSAAESLMFCLKHGYRFGRMGRRGLEAVRREMNEKALAYNFDRMILLRRRRAKPVAA